MDNEQTLDDARHRERFHGMNNVELAEAWEEPMPDPVRAVLLNELERRGYRIKSLATPPPSDAAPVSEMLSGETTPGSEKAGHGVGVILFLAIVQLLGGGLIGFVEANGYSSQLEVLAGVDGSEMTEIEGRAMPADQARFALQFARFFAIGLPVGLGLVFLVLFFWGRTHPRPALWIALLLFIGGSLLTGLAESRMSLIGLPVKIIIVIALINGIRGAAQVARAKVSEEPDGAWSSG